MELTVTPEIERLVEAKLASGAYASPDDVILAGLRLLETHDRSWEERLEALRRDIAVGIDQADRGETEPLDMQEIQDEGRRLLAQRRGNG